MIRPIDPRGPLARSPGVPPTGALDPCDSSLTVTSTPADPPAPRPRWRVWAERLLPWVLTVGAVAYILSQHSLASIVAEMRHGSVVWLLPLGAWVTVQGLLVASLADLWVIRAAQANARPWPRYRDVAVAKAGVGLFEAVGYAVGRGGYGVWIARAAGTGPGPAAGAVLYMVLADLAAVATVLTGSIYLAGAEVPGAMRLVAPLGAAAIWALVLLAPGWPFDPARLPGPLRPLVHLPRRLAAPQIGLRMINIVFGCVMTWVAARSFGMELPVDVVAVYMPVVLVVASLPINVAGIGPASGAWLFFFGDYAEAPQILAFQLLWTFAIVAAIVLRGLPFVRTLVREIAAPRPGS